MDDIAVTRISKKQQILRLSTNEANLATSSVCHGIWFRNLLKNLRLV